MLEKLRSHIKNTDHRWYLGIIFISCMVVVGLSILMPGTFDTINAQLNDQFFRMRYRLFGRQEVDDALIHVDLTDSDISALKLSNWDRSVYGRVLDVINEAGVRMIGVDILFEYPLIPEVDEALAASTGKGANVYYPVVLDVRGKQKKPAHTVMPELIFKPLLNSKGDALSGRVLYRPFKALSDQARGLGYINDTPDGDGINRKIPLVIAHADNPGEYIPCLALRMVCDYLEVEDGDIHITFGKHIILNDALRPDGSTGDIIIPIDRRGSMLINWCGPRHDSFPRYSIRKMLLAGIEPVFKEMLKERIAGKIAIISDISTKNQDQGMGIYGNMYPLSTVHTAIMNTILTGNFLTGVLPGQRFGVFVALIILLYVAACRFRSVYFMGAAGIVYMCYVVFSFTGFIVFNRLGYLFVPTVIFGTAVVVISGYNLYRETKEKIIINEYGKLKNNFYLNIAHETKTPLTLILNYLDKYLENNSMNTDLAIIKQNVDKLRVDMLNFMDAEAVQLGKTIYRHDGTVDITDFVTRKVSAFEPIYEKKDIALQVTVPEYECFVRVHPAALDRIMNNLLDNALKYTEAGGRTHVDVCKVNGRITLVVRDTGIGMAHDEVDKVFLPYYQAARHKSTGRGIGMGLYIIKEIIDELGGELLVDSKPGKGSAFTVVLPASTPDTDEAVITDGVLDTCYSQLIEPVFEEQACDHSRYTVLVVEDNRQLLASLYHALINEYTVVYASNGREALEKLATVKVPDVIVSDILMDEMDGYAFYKNLIKMPKYHSIPFIFITAKSGGDEKIKALELGAVDFISKPFVLAELKAKIASLIEVQVSKKLDIMDHMDDYKQSVITDRFDDYNITPTERKVIEYILEGKQNKEIAGYLKITERTVKYHVSNVFKKCGVQNRVELTSKFSL